MLNNKPNMNILFVSGPPYQTDRDGTFQYVGTPLERDTSRGCKM